MKQSEDYYWKGERVETTGTPYMFAGGEFIDAHDANGKNITMPTHTQRAANVERAKVEWREQQGQFANLRNQL